MSTSTLPRSALSARFERAAKAAAAVAEELSDLAEKVRADEERLAGFRSNSGARLVAAILLGSPGQWFSRSELAEAAGVPGSTIPRVVKQLRGAPGVIVERHVLPDKSAAYRVVLT